MVFWSWPAAGGIFGAGVGCRRGLSCKGYAVGKTIVLNIKAKASITAGSPGEGWNSEFKQSAFERAANDLNQSACVVTVAAGGQEAVPLGDVASPSVFCARHLSGGAVSVGWLIGGVTFVPFADLYGNYGEACGLPLPAAPFPGVLYLKNSSGSDAQVETWIQ